MEGSLFAGVHYYINEKQVKNPAEVKQILKRGGASREFYISELVTHVISDELPAGDEDGSTGDKALSPLQDQDHVTVKSDWVVMSQKCGAQLPTTPFEVSDNKLFSGLVFCPSKLPTGDVEKLCILLMFHGGKMQRRLDSSVTHLVTTETAGTKYECAEKHSSMKVISPDWILDSVEAGTRMEEKLYHPSGLKLSLVGTAGGREVCNGGVATLKRPEETLEQHPQADSGAMEKQLATAPRSNHHAVPDSSAGTSLNVLESGSSVAPPSDLAVAPPTHQEGPGGSDAAAGGGLSTPTPVTRADQLLDGVVIYFTDYQDCVEDETLNKWKLVVRQHGGDVLDMYDPDKVTHLLALHKKSVFFTRALEEGKCIASAHWLDDVLTEQKMFPPRTPIHFPTAFQWQFPNAEAYSMTLTNYIGAERELVKDMLRICGIPYTGHLSRENTHLICKKAEGRKYEKAVEWGIQVVNSTFLADVIHNGELPMVLYPCYTTLNQSNEFHSDNSMEASRILKLWKTFLGEYKLRHPDLMAASEEQAGSTGDRKRGREGETEPAEAGNRKLRKRQTEGAPPSQPPVVLFTGISTTAVKPFKQIVARLGGVITESPRACSHIVTPKVARTIKFLSGISVCRHMVTPKWVEESERQGRFAPESDFELKDPDAEQLFGMDLPTSLARAQSRKLLEGMCVYATPSIQPPQDSLGDIVSCAGGRLLTLTEVRSMLAASRAAAGSLIVVSTPGDIENGSCKEFTTLGIKVFNAELILTGVLKQILEYSQYTFLIDD